MALPDMALSCFEPSLAICRVSFVTRRGTAMAKEEVLEMDGVVAEVLPDARYRVRLTNGHDLVAYSAGKVRKHRIRIIAGDRVSLEISPYDLSKGRITFRHIEAQQAPAAIRRRRF